MARVQPIWKHGPHPSGDRRREVEGRLAAEGLPPGRNAQGEGPLSDFGARLRRALQPLGPVLVAFGRYLGSRPDLLPAQDCLELTALSDLAEALPPALVLERIAAETGCRSIREVFASIDEEPLVSRSFIQVHRARLPGGETVAVKLVRPEAEAALASDLQLLPLLREALGGTSFPFAEVLADFRHSLTQCLDLTVEAEGLGLLAADAAESPQLWVPRLVHDLTTPRMLTRELISGVSLRQLAGQSGGPDAARRLVQVWLRQALLGRGFAVEPRLSEILITPDGRVAFSGGLWASLPAATQTNLWEYLGAAVTRGPAEACAHLVPEMARTPQSVTEAELFLRMRQIVPFRDGSWSSGGDTLAEHLFVQWRVARAGGYRPFPSLLGFCRGFCAVAAAAHRLAPDSDPLREGLEELRLDLDVGRLRGFLGPERLAEGIGPYATLLMQVPQKLDDLLTLLSSGEARLRLQMDDGAETRGRQSPLASVLTLAAGAAAVALLAHQLASPAFLGVWGERLGAAALLLMGALLLRALSRL